METQLRTGSPAHRARHRRYRGPDSRRQQLALFNTYYDSRCFQRIDIYQATTPVAIILRAPARPRTASPLIRCCGAKSALPPRMPRSAGSTVEAEKVRRYGEFRYAAKSRKIERRVIARVEAGPQGTDSRFIVTNLAGLPKALYEKVYCAAG
jgi:hypothetical protein